jgi:hypothetical protein
MACTNVFMDSLRIRQYLLYGSSDITVSNVGFSIGMVSSSSVLKYQRRAHYEGHRPLRFVRRSLASYEAGTILRSTVTGKSLISGCCAAKHNVTRAYHHRSMYSLERLLEYSSIEQEPKATQAGTPPAYWPASGDLRVEKLSAGYSVVSVESTAHP